jgi:hypothetical protein
MLLILLLRIAILLLLLEMVMRVVRGMRIRWSISASLRRYSIVVDEDLSIIRVIA